MELGNQNGKNRHSEQVLKKVKVKVFMKNWLGQAKIWVFNFLCVHIISITFIYFPSLHDCFSSALHFSLEFFVCQSYQNEVTVFPNATDCGFHILLDHKRFWQCMLVIPVFDMSHTSTSKSYIACWRSSSLHVKAWQKIQLHLLSSIMHLNIFALFPPSGCIFTNAPLDHPVMQQLLQKDVADKC